MKQGVVVNHLALPAIGAVRNLASNSEPNREALRKAGVIQPLVAFIRDAPDGEGASDAVAALRNLARNNPANRDEIRETGAIPYLVGFLSAGANKEITAHAAAALANLSYGNRENQEAIRQAGAIRPLLKLLGQNKDVTTYAAGALANVANPAFALAGSCVWLCPPFSRPPQANASLAGSEAEELPKFIQ